MSTSIRNSVLLYKASLSVWSARKLDKGESMKVAQANNAKDGTARVHKDLLPDCKELDIVRSWAGEFRQWVYLHTVPWDDNGWRAGHVSKHMDFMQEAGDRLAVGDALVDQFMAVYEAAIAQAQFDLNDLFNPADYETVEQVRRKFAFTLDVQPIGNAQDFRVVEGLTQAEADRLVTSAEAASQARITAAMDEAYQRLYDVVNKMATTLKAFGDKEIKKFNDTLVGNLAELVEVMPSLNLTGDPKLAALAEQAKLLTLFDLTDLRKSDTVRAEAISQAAALAALFGPADAVVPEAEAKPVTTVSAGALADLLQVA